MSALARILVADDSEVWRVKIRSILQGRPDWEVVGEACDGLQPVQKTTELRPDVVLLDIGMPILHGIEAAKRIRQSSPDSRIIFVTLNNDREVEVPTSSRRPPFFHFCWTTNIINSAKSTSIVLTCARTSASIAVRSPIISILSLVPSLPVVVNAAIVLGSGFSFR